jgi:RNA polymerase sigma-70 factor (ECF subfamily)
MDLTLQTFNQHRPRLMGIAYRMLGSRVDAEDILQDTYLRWHHTDTSVIDNAEAWLVTATTRLCIDKLRSVKTERERYIGPWVPEPIVSDDPSSPEHAAIMAGDISLAFLLTLERLAPEERAAFLLREVFDFEYGEIARVLAKNESACRQIVHRAKDRVQQNRPRFTVAADAHKRLLDRFIAATGNGDEEQMLQLFADDIRMYADGGGKVTAALRILNGGARVMRLHRAIARRMIGMAVRYEQVNVNGEIGLLRYVDGKLDAVYSFVTDGARILELYVVRNPDKFTGVFTAFPGTAQTGHDHGGQG